ncbi:Putative Cytosol aminopeptidase (fragment) [endosymbiont DhMRE of Dentiscutata heterogama]|uniref:hypothetical protein n=1 Tax=endosymbiont DhMRE of Dentiscutata heterogama TaxID=1609546 RepID=UPI000629D341
MTTLFIKKSPQSKLLTLCAITNKDKAHPLVEKKPWKTTLISEKKTLYLYIDKENEDYNFFNLYHFFVNFSGNNERSLNIDIQSFISKNLSEEEAIQAISEGILFGSHPKIRFSEKKS